MRDLRISLDQLRVVDSPSAEKFAAVNRELEIVTVSDFPSVCRIITSMVARESPFGRLIMMAKQPKPVDRTWLICRSLFCQAMTRLEGS